jgi:hypothetical protein
LAAIYVCLLNGIVDKLISEHKDDEKMQIQASMGKIGKQKQLNEKKQYRAVRHVSFYKTR